MGQAAEEDILPYRQVVDRTQLLVDDRDAQLQRLARIRELNWPAIEQDLPLVQLERSRKDLHQRRLAGAVLADDR